MWFEFRVKLSQNAKAYIWHFIKSGLFWRKLRLGLQSPLKSSGLSSVIVSALRHGHVLSRASVGGMHWTWGPKIHVVT